MPRARFLVVAAVIAALLLAGVYQRRREILAERRRPRRLRARAEPNGSWRWGTATSPVRVPAGPRTPTASRARSTRWALAHTLPRAGVRPIPDVIGRGSLRCRSATAEGQDARLLRSDDRVHVRRRSLQARSRLRRRRIGPRRPGCRSRNFASAHQVSDVVVSIGGNDFGFGPVIAQCAGAFFSTVGRPQQRPCRTIRGSAPIHRGAATAHRDPDHRCVAQCREGDAASRVRDGRVPAGRPDVPVADPARSAACDIGETIFERGLIGGCPFFSVDATWANKRALAAINGAVTGAAAGVDLDNLRVLDLTDALVGHRLCEQGVGPFDPRGSRPGATMVSPTRWSGSTGSTPAPGPGRYRSLCIRTTGACWQLESSSLTCWRTSRALVRSARRYPRCTPRPTARR